MKHEHNAMFLKIFSFVRQSERRNIDIVFTRPYSMFQFSSK